MAGHWQVWRCEIAGIAASIFPSHVTILNKASFILSLKKPRVSKNTYIKISNLISQLKYTEHEIDINPITDSIIRSNED
jgi:hypothetical protein